MCLDIQIHLVKFIAMNNINELFKIGRQYSEDFLFLFDHAYLVHDFLPTKDQTPVWKLAEQKIQPIKQ